MKRKILALTAVIGLLLLTAGCGGGEKKDAVPAAGKTYKVGIVQLVEHSALDAANKGFVAGLANQGLKEGTNVTFDRQNAQADQSNLQISPSGL